MASSSRNEIQLGVRGGVRGSAAEQSMKKIQRIPYFLRSKSDDDYDPKVVSLGPYHHGKAELQSLQGFKHKLLQEFISKSSLAGAAFSINEVLEVVDAARRCYVDGSTDEFDDTQFAEMMLLDACFLLYFILSGMEYLNHIFIRSNAYLLEQFGYSTYFFIQHDTFLFENQIPLFIVELLFNALCGNILGIRWKDVLVKHCKRILFGVDYKEEDEDRDYRPLHLLEAFHMHMLCKSHSTQLFLPSSSDPAAAAACSPTITPAGKNTTIMLQKETFEKFGYVFRSVMDLKSKGIHFACSDNIYSMMSIQFESNHMYAKLKLPIWCATAHSRVLFTNMIAYEMCPNSCTHLELISYINFMKSLIIYPNDVKELREKRIIQNELGDDLEVVQLFKGLNTYGIDNPYIFREVKRKIQEHYDNKAKTWMAELLYTYLRSPWAVIGLLAASVLLLLTFAQTFAAYKWHN